MSINPCPTAPQEASRLTAVHCCKALLGPLIPVANNRLLATWLAPDPDACRLEEVHQSSLVSPQPVPSVHPSPRSHTRYICSLRRWGGIVDVCFLNSALAQIPKLDRAYYDHPVRQTSWTPTLRPWRVCAIAGYAGPGLGPWDACTRISLPYPPQNYSMEYLARWPEGLFRLWQLWDPSFLE